MTNHKDNLLHYAANLESEVANACVFAEQDKDSAMRHLERARQHLDDMVRYVHRIDLPSGRVK